MTSATQKSWAFLGILWFYVLPCRVGHNSSERGIYGRSSSTEGMDGCISRYCPILPIGFGGLFRLQKIGTKRAT
ncbi:MAG TPA: hypothetical protein VN957_05200, partial [Chthoniobacterales bacterium]|nr:hypothetical protein [Chthoniobacterales bacterium]